MLHWLHTLFPSLPHYGYALVCLVVLLNNVGLPLPGETIVIGAGFVLERGIGMFWQPLMAATTGSFLGSIAAFAIGRRLGLARLQKIRWLHLSAAQLQWPTGLIKRHGAKTVFLARFIPLFPPAAVNVLAGMSKMRWSTFLLLNFTGAAAYSAFYLALGYLFGKQWRLLARWLGPTAPYLIFGGVALVVIGVVFRKRLLRIVS